MTYILDKHIYYCPDDGSIRLNDGTDQDVTLLTPVPNRILSLLIENQGKLIGKEVFLTQVWDNHGKMGSSNSLKQNIALIRKILDRYLGKNAIVTLPGQGYLFSVDITVEHVEKKNVDNPSVPPPSIAPRQSDSDKAAKRRIYSGKAHESKIWYGLLLLIVGCFIFQLYHTLQFNSIMPTYTLDNEGECRIFSLQEYQSPADQLQIKSRSTETLRQLKLSCTRDDKYFYYDNNAAVNDARGVSRLIMQCGDAVTKEVGCVTYRTNR
ncbi:hypothetical protein CIG19_13835 [Enterobacterales bacterium CwR94]|nr:hypothetical protein CIG19_13835 [Enterobacterales bacterium CwR94]